MGESVKVRTNNLARAMFQECVAAIIGERHWHKEQIKEAAGPLDLMAKEEEALLRLRPMPTFVTAAPKFQ